MATQTGARTTTNILSDQLAIDISDRISMLEPDVQILTVFSRAAGKKRTVATKFSWLEDKHKARFDATGATATNSVATITVVTGTSFAIHDQVLNTRTGEQFRVDGVNGNVLNVTRGIGSTAAAMNLTDELYIIGSSQPENDTAKVARSDNAVKTQNNTQIFRESFEQSGSLMASDFMVSPADWPHQQKKKGGEHVKDIELSLLFSRKSATTPGSSEDRTTGGVLSFISTNQTDAGGDLSEAEFNAFMAQQGRYSSVNKLAMASAVGVSALNKFPASKQQTKNDETTYGMNVTHYTSPFGSLNLVYHRLLEGTKYGGVIIVVDLDEVQYRYLANDTVSRDTKVLTNRQPNSQDGRMDEYLTECGLEFGQERKHGVLTGITS
jgi:hypothetical protein